MVTAGGSNLQTKIKNRTQFCTSDSVGNLLSTRAEPHHHSMNITSSIGLETTPLGNTPRDNDSKLEGLPTAPSVCDECSNETFEICWKLKNPNSKPGDSDFGFAGYRCKDCHSVYHDRRQEFPGLQSKRRDPDWEEIFGHPEPYDHQREAIEQLIDTAKQGGFMVTEGGCGTGKTMVALTGGLKLVRDPSTKFNRLFILTSVKQQLTQFENDLRIINQNLPDDVAPASGLTLVGKGDLCPYARETEAGFDQDNVNHECHRLRSGTNRVMAEHNVSGGALSLEAERINDDDWGSAGAKSPYPKEIPRRGKEYCPFYAEYQRFGGATFRFDHAEDNILNANELVRLGVQQGMCPHSAMSSFVQKSEVIMGNYYHGFDFNTLQITGEIIDESTLIICDEAHMLEPRVRSILSRDASLSSIERAADEVARVVATMYPDEIDDDREINGFAKYDVAFEEIQKAAVPRSFLTDLLTFLDNFALAIRATTNKYLNENYSNWENKLHQLPDTMEIPLREPDSPEPDLITDWVNQTGVPEHVWKYATEMGEVIEEILNESEKESTGRSITEVADLLSSWFERDHINHFRELKLDDSSSPYYSTSDWEERFEVSAEFHNVFPRIVLGNRLTDFGGGLLMSATIAPMDIYTELTGLDYYEEMGGTVTHSRYDPSFPPENNLSVTLDLPDFTYTNRGDPGSRTELRERYAKAITSVARTTEGNVLICMPSYKEARWIAKRLRANNCVSKPVMVDQSSSEQATKELKQEFFAGRSKVLTTSLKGTLTEGVDYKGDKLNGCVVCGVPIDNVKSPKVQAVHRAYQERYQNNYQLGFEYGLTLPAVRKTRQALGRVIRSNDDVGVRILIDHRYTIGEDEGGLRHYLSPTEQDQYEIIDDEAVLERKLKEFWKEKGS